MTIKDQEPSEIQETDHKDDTNIDINNANFKALAKSLGVDLTMSIDELWQEVAKLEQQAEQNQLHLAVAQRHAIKLGGGHEH
ncbi:MULTISPECIES: hypothetical protein [unclassified Pseudoalteromonas]|jgi:ketopantoate reductase|uniref:hypothetical protein n=1 Tax=unclassified Pseudoalteromonas TaxID=194690 RepID=UPI0006D6828E|nr:MULTISPECIES: hypothetical protein [unclassified Pseudoalteromonas]KPZ65679.1 hypothetical protein AN392_01227 [Pseudoalteromonas sp. P1-16-1b]MDC9565864.1 hypothetical protein [Pseudoalteromonas sp. GAB2316C]MDC9570197.1 hypothetical protein [Pseudoalteromonas sp. GABNB9D]MDC9574387.1 hypothetical protein [Pseudoalteromonas sp. GABNS16A]MDC9578692.1 hypothetical protein [Pseudoalteromonas sp. GABNS16E]